MSEGVTYPRGFVAAAVAAGLKPSGRPDLALLVGPAGTSAAGVFTTNRVAAAPVTLSRARLAQGRGRAVLVNSGQANAGTGRRGEEDAISSTDAAAKLLDVDAADVLACSTGVIGEPMHLTKVLHALPELVDALATEGGRDFATAIMTTDTVVKVASADTGVHRVGGAAKGSGMIAPNLATMLAFVTTDAAIAAGDLDALVRAELAPRFEALTVDACSSTNDTVLLLASGAAGEPPVTAGSRPYTDLRAALGEVGDDLASQLIHDAEGGTHVLVVDVEGTEDDEDARILAKAVADSPLVKTAVFGEDPNPGRILQAVGSSGVELYPSLIDAWIGDAQLVVGGVIAPSYFEADDLRDAARRAMRAPEVAVRVRVGDGPGASRALGCDLSHDYVRINGEYTT